MTVAAVFVAFYCSVFLNYRANRVARNQHHNVSSLLWDSVMYILTLRTHLTKFLSKRYTSDSLDRGMADMKTSRSSFFCLMWQILRSIWRENIFRNTYIQWFFKFQTTVLQLQWTWLSGFLIIHTYVNWTEIQNPLLDPVVYLVNGSGFKSFQRNIVDSRQREAYVFSICTNSCWFSTYVFKGN